MTVSERIKEIRKVHFHDSNIEFANFMGEKPSTTSGWVSGKRGVGNAVLKKISEKLPNVNITWLITGEGSMDNPQIDNSQNKSNNQDAHLIETPYILNVPLVSQYAQAGYLNGYADETYMLQLPTIPYIVDHEAQGHYVAFEVKGDSMNDGTDESIKEGDRLLCREVAPHLWISSPLHIRKWDFVIVHKEGVLVKRIIDHCVDNHTITIHSLNPLFPDKVIDLADVMQIFNVIELQRPKRR